MQKIPFESFKEVVKHTPLISIDFIFENPEGEILLGWRKNNPAKGFWFVPGGRILKNEKFEDAFRRIAKSEVGVNISIGDTSFLGIYEHIYPNENFADDPSFDTHYIVLAYRYKLSEKLTTLPEEQHTDYWWATLDDIIEDPNIHENTKNYFNGFPSFTE
jgi:colanic acid biosynthesis protein WcaH